MPTSCWIIVEGEVREVRPRPKAEREALPGKNPSFEGKLGLDHQVAYDPEIPTDTVYWTKENADEALFRSTQPVEAAWRDLQEGLISAQDFLGLVGTLEGKKRLDRG